MLDNIRIGRLLAGDKGVKRSILSITLFILNHLRTEEIRNYVIIPDIKRVI